MPRAAIALAVGLALTATAIGVVLSRAPLTVAATNGTAAREDLAYIGSRASVCQAGEALPGGVSAIAASLSSVTGPRVAVEVRSDGRLLTRGEHGSGWTGRSVTIPVRRVAGTVANVQICLAFTAIDETVIPRGEPSAPEIAATWNGKALPGRLTFEYLRPGGHSWFSKASAVVYHMGLGRLPGGAWAGVLVIVLMVAVTTITSGVILGELR